MAFAGPRSTPPLVTTKRHNASSGRHVVRQPPEKDFAFAQDCLCGAGDVGVVSIRLCGHARQQCQSLTMQSNRQVQARRSLERLPHFLQQQQLRKASMKPTGYTRLCAPVEGRKGGTRPLSGTQAIECLAAAVTKRLALRMDPAPKIGFQILAGLPAQLVVAELA